MAHFTRSDLTRRRWLRTMGWGGLSVAGLVASGKVARSEVATGQMPHRLELQAGELTATVVDNHDGLAGEQQAMRRARMPVAEDHQLFSTVGFEDRFNGYNGLARLQHAGSSSPFCPCISGQNCEFFFDQITSTYEPRWRDLAKFEAQPSALKRLSDSAARLRIEPGERRGVQVESQFELVPPYYVDVEHTFTPTAAAPLTDVLGVFWASYIQLPAVPCFYFRARQAGAERWTSIYEALQYGASGTVAPENGPVGTKLGRRLDPRSNRTRNLLYDVPDTRYAKPFYCGNINGMLLSYMFQPGDGVEVRLAFNATGGGPGVPAWDFQASVASPRVNQRYAFKVRMVYKPFDELDEALQLYDQWAV